MDLHITILSAVGGLLGFGESVMLLFVGKHRHAADTGQETD